MNDKTKSQEKLREILSSDFKSLKKSRSDLEDTKKTDLITGLKGEKDVLVEHGGAVKKIGEIVEALKGEVVTDEHVEMVQKYLTYLRNQMTTIQQNIKMEEETKEIENML